MNGGGTYSQNATGRLEEDHGMLMRKTSDLQVVSTSATGASRMATPSLKTVESLQGRGHIEWICPSAEEIFDDPPEDFSTIVVNPLFNDQAGNVDRISRLIAMRVKSLIEGTG